MARETVIQSSLIVKNIQNPNTTASKFAVLTGSNNLFGFRTGTELLADLNITSANITDFSEAVDDRVSTLLVNGTNISLSYNDGANTLTISTTGLPSGSGATNRVAFWNTSTDLTSNANFIFDGSNLIVGTTTAASSTRFTTRGSNTGNSTFGYTHQNSSGTAVFSVADDGTTIVGASGNGITISSSTITRSNGLTIGTGGTVSILTLGDNTISGGISGYGITMNRQMTQSSGSGALGVLEIAPSLIQTGSGTGITRGIYLNPSLTTIVDFRAIDIAVNDTVAWGVYQSGASTRNYFAGSVSIGTTSTGNALRVSGTPRFDLGSDATGDIYYRNSSGNFTRLGIGTNGQVLNVSGSGIPAWITPSAGNVSSVGATDSADIDFTVTNPTTTPDITAVLTTTGVTANSYGNNTSVATFTVDSKGRITTAATTSIQLAETQITDGSLLARNGGNETISGSWTFSNNVVIPTTPTQSNHAASKSYVDNLVTGLDWKNSVRAASTANVSVTYSSTGGTSARGQITAAPNTLDGVTLANTNRILLKDQSTGAQNGIWVVTTVGTGANGVWDRATDFDEDAEVTAGVAVFVTEGTTNGDSGWVLTTNDAITIGGASGTALTFAQFSGAGQITAGAGLTKTGNTLDVGTASASRIVVNADNIDLATTTVTPNSYGSASSVATFTVDAYGRLTAAASTAISIASTAVSDFAEAVDDRVDALFTAGSGITKSYNDGANTLTVAVDTAVVATTSNTLTMTNKTLTSPTINTPILTVNDNQFTIQDQTDTTKKAVFEASGITTATTRTYTLPNASGTIALTSNLSSYQPLDATLTALAAFNTNGILTQTAADTFVGRTITGSSSITVNDGNGVAGNPTISVISNSSTQKVEVTKNSGAVVGTRKQLNFIEGTNITLTIADDAGNDQVDITITGASSTAYSTIEEEGTPLTQRTSLNFVGSGITASDNTTKTNVALDADLNALADLATTGLATRTASNTWTTRSLSQPAAGLTISNSDGVAGNPTFALANDLAALEGLGSTGIAARTASDTWAVRTITGSTSTAGPGFTISITNGTGVSGNPTISLDSSDYTYKYAVRAASTGNIATLSGLLTVDGVTLVANDRVLVKDQSTASANGIYLASAAAWARDADATASADFQGGQVIFVKEGTNNSDSLWSLTTDGTITVGSTSLTYKRIGRSNQATAGSYGSASQVPVFTLNDDGTISGTPTNTAISIASTAVSDFAEAVDDRVDALFTAGSGITKSYNDGANTLTVAVDTAVVATTSNTLTMTNKTLTSPTINTPILTVNDNQFTIQDQTDTTKKAVFEANGITTGTTRTYTLPNASGTIALTSDIGSYIDGAGVANQYAYFSDSNTLTSSSGAVFTSSSIPLDMSAATGAINLPVGTDAQRPANAAGLVRGSSDNSTLEYNFGSGWGLMAFRNVTQTITSQWTFSGDALFTGTLARFTDSNFTIVESSANGAAAKFDTGSITAATTRTYVMPNANGTLALTSDLTSYLTGNGSSGRVPYYSGTTTLTNDANFIFDGSNLIVGTTTAATSTRLTLRGSSTGSSTYTLTTQDSAGTQSFAVDDLGALTIGKSSRLTVSASAITPAQTFTIGNSAFAVQLRNSITSATAILLESTVIGGSITFGNSSYNSNTTNKTTAFFSDSFAPTSTGTNTFAALTLNNTINQTGGHTGITRGLYVLPTLTAFSDYRAIEIGNTATNSYGIYQSGANVINYFAGNVSIGTTSTGNALRVSGTPRFDLGSDATGDIYYRNSSGNFTRLGIGTTGQVLNVSGGGLPAWTTPSTGNVSSVGATDSADIDFTVTNPTTTPDITAVLTTTGVSANSYGSASAVATFTVDSKGRLSTAATTSIQIAETQITDGSLLARVADNETISGNWTFSNNVVIPTTPTQSNHAASKSYVDNLITGLDWKNSVRAASTATVTVTYNATGGTSARGQITAAPNTLDGVSLAANDRILLKDQSTGAQNGIWVVTTLGTGANGVWDRATDFDQDAEVTAGVAVFVTEGTTNGDSGWVLTTNDTITIGGASGTALTFAQFSGAGQITAGAGLTKTGNTIDIGTASASRIVVNADNIDLATTTVTPNSYGSASSVATFTVDAYGRLTAAASTAISIASTAVSDFAEAVDDRVDALFTAGSGITKSYNDGANTLTVAVDTAVVATTSNTLTMTNKTLTSPTINTPILTVNDNQFTIQDQTDTTKKAVFEASGISASTTRTYTLPNASGTIALTSDIGSAIDGTGVANQYAYFSDSNTLTSSSGAVFTSSTIPLDMSSATGAMRLPVGTDAQRPANAAGLVRGSSDNTTLEYNFGSGWGLMAFRNVTQTITSQWTFSGDALFTGTLARFTDSNFTIIESSANGAAAKFDTGSITAATTRTYVMPDANGTLALTSDLTSYLTGNGSSGRVPYYSGTTTLTNDANFIFDGSNLIVGTTTAATSTRLTLRGSSTGSSTYTLTTQDSAGTQSFAVDDLGTLTVGKSSRLTIGANTITPAQTFTIGNSAFAVQIRNSITSATAILLESTVIGGSITFGNSSYNSNTTSKTTAFFSDSFAPTSTGTNTFAALTLNNTINQTGGHTGITRGLYILPTLTAFSDYRAIEIGNTATNSYGIYQSGTNVINLFGGNTGIGASPGSNKFAVVGSIRFDVGSDATGDIFYRNSGGNFTRLGIGSSGQVLSVSSGLPSWQNASGSTVTEVFIEGFSGSTVDLDANTGTVKDYNNNNVAFTLPSNLNALDVFKNGLKLARTGVTTRDYSLNAGTNEITFTVAIATTDVIIIRKIA